MTTSASSQVNPLLFRQVNLLFAATLSLDIRPIRPPGTGPSRPAPPVNVMVNVKCRSAIAPPAPCLPLLQRRGHHGQGPQPLLRWTAEEASPAPAGETSFSAGRYLPRDFDVTPSVQPLTRVWELFKNARF